MQEFPEQDDIEEFNFSFLEIKINEGVLNQTQAVIVAQYGAPSIFVEQYLSKAQVVGHLTQTTSNPLKLATIKQLDQLLFIVYEKDIRYYHFQEYNLLKQLDLKDQQIIILTNVTASGLENYSSDQSELRQLNHKIPSQLKQLEGELEGYYGELLYSLAGRKAIALILVQTNFDLSVDVVQKFEQIQKILPSFPTYGNHNFVKEQIKKYNKSISRDNVHI